MAVAAQFDHFHANFLAVVQNSVGLQFFLLTLSSSTRTGMGADRPVPVEVVMGYIDVQVDRRISAVESFHSKLQLKVRHSTESAFASDGHHASSRHCPRVIPQALSQCESSCLCSCQIRTDRAVLHKLVSE